MRSVPIGTATGGAPCWNRVFPFNPPRMPASSTRRHIALFSLLLMSATRLEAQRNQVEADVASRKPSPMLFVTPFLSSGWSQTLGTPNAWKRTWGGYGSRVGDQVGSLVVRESVRRLVDHAVPWVDDRSPCVSQPVSLGKEVVVRAGCAIARTSTLRTAGGDRRPNLPFFTGVTVGTVTSLSWRPERHSAASSRAFVAQRLAIGYGSTVLVRLVRDWRADAAARP